MKVVFDLHHPADINFFKNSINILLKKGIEIELIIRARGSIVSIARKELPNIPFKIHGKHQSSLYKKIFGVIKRDLELLFYLRRVKYDVGVSGGFEVCSVSKILGKPSIAFVDDYEYKLLFNMARLSATYLYMPYYIPIKAENIHKYKGLKELAYLHPKYFKPNKKTLEHYGLKQNEYVFIREIAGISMNYQGSSSKLHEIVQFLKETGFQIVVSLENKSLIEKFKENCVVLEEPVEDIYSLLSFAAMTISSGDTMARESCLVGTPTIYSGGRDMRVNKELIEKGCMFKANDISEIISSIKYIIDNNLKNNTMEIINYNIKHNWDDITEFIVESIIKAAS